MNIAVSVSDFVMKYLKYPGTVPGQKQDIPYSHKYLVSFPLNPYRGTLHKNTLTKIRFGKIHFGNIHFVKIHVGKLHF